MKRTPLGLLFLLVCACSSDDDDADDGVATTISSASQSGTQATSSEPATETGDSTGEQNDCSSYIDTFEGCGINGCAAGPTNLNGTVFAGGACNDAPECSPTLCTCASDATVQWYAASCGCDVCTDGDEACARTAAVACPT